MTYLLQMELFSIQHKSIISPSQLFFLLRLYENPPLVSIKLLLKPLSSADLNVSFIPCLCCRIAEDFRIIEAERITGKGCGNMEKKLFFEKQFLDENGRVFRLAYWLITRSAKSPLLSACLKSGFLLTATAGFP